MRKLIFRHTNIGGDNWIYQDDITGIVDVETPRYTPNTDVLIEYEDAPQPSDDNPLGLPFITIDFNTQQIIDLKIINTVEVA